MIHTTVAPFVLVDGNDQSFNLSSILSEPTYFPILERWAVQVRILSSVDTSEIARDYVEFAKATVDAKTGTGTGDTAKALNAVEQCVKDHYSAIPDNSGVTFTIV